MDVIQQFQFYLVLEDGHLKKIAVNFYKSNFFIKYIEISNRKTT